MEKLIGGELFKKINDEWYKLSKCGFVFRECNISETWIAENWITY